MSRFDYDGDGEGGMPWQLWEATLSRALGGRRGQETLAQMETALLGLPKPRLIEGRLAGDGGVCAVGAYVAQQRARELGVDMAAAIEAISVDSVCWCDHGRDLHDDESCRGVWTNGRPCGCSGFRPESEDASETADAGLAAGLGFSIAWHLAYLNDEEFGAATPEQRYELMLGWVRRAQGKPERAHA